MEEFETQTQLNSRMRNAQLQGEQNLQLNFISTAPCILHAAAPSQNDWKPLSWIKISSTSESELQLASISSYHSEFPTDSHSWRDARTRGSDRLSVVSTHFCIFRGEQVTVYHYKKRRPGETNWTTKQKKTVKIWDPWRQLSNEKIVMPLHKQQVELIQSYCEKLV